MQQSLRNQAIENFINAVEAGKLPSIGSGPSGLRITRPNEDPDTRKCIVCHVPLLGIQRDLCSGHWDFVIIDQSLRSYRDITDYLKQDMIGLYITHEKWQGHWYVLFKGGVSCEVCRQRTTLIESLCNAEGKVLKSHRACPDHASFRWDELTPYPA
jgi:hypothetical protein